jgi:hypothetical protein
MRRPRERSGEDDLAGFERFVGRRELVGEPRDAIGRTVEDRGRMPGPSRF